MTSNAAQQLATSVRFTLSVKSGPDAGRSYQLLPPKVTIGRDPGNNIPLKDPKVSRNHTVIEFKPDRIVASDVSSRDNMLINGKAEKESPLKDGDVLSIGETKLVFRIEITTSRPAHLQVASSFPQNLSLQRPSGPMGAPGNFEPRSPQAPPRVQHAGSGETAKKFRFYLIAAIVLGSFVYMVTSEEVEKKKDLGLRTSEEIEAEIRSTEERIEVISKQREFKSEEERKRYEEAQAHYLQGFRDFQKGGYSRAMRAFETARAIDPGHEMAKRYYTLAARQRDEFVARHMIEGRQYRDKNMFSRCVASIDIAIKVLGESSSQDLKIKEAKSLRDECEAMLKERF